MTSTSEHPRVEYSYSYQNTPTGGDSDSLVIKLRCPGISSFKWCLKLYSLVLGGLGLLLSFIWVCFHLYVLSQTSLQELRQQRYLDIFLGLLLLLAMLSLLYGGFSQSSLFIIVFLASSLAVLIAYWCWYFYTKYAGGDYPVFEEEVGEIGCILTLLYTLLVLPILLLYRSMEMLHTNQEEETERDKRNYPPEYQEEAVYPSL